MVHSQAVDIQLILHLKEGNINMLFSVNRTATNSSTVFVRTWR